MTRLRSVFSFTLTFAALLALFAGCYYAGVAHAAVEVPDPVGQGQMAVDTAAALIQQQGPVIGGAVLLYALGGWFLRHHKTAPWLMEGKRFAYTSAGLMVAGAVLQWKVGSAPFEGVFAALVTAWGLVMHPTVKTAPTPTA